MAQKWLEKAMLLRPKDTEAKAMLAEAFYRRHDFQKAADSLSGVDLGSNKLITSPDRPRFCQAIRGDF